MPVDPPEDAHAAGVEQFEYFGFSTYAANTFLALVSLGTGSAREISDVPRTRVYDAVDELHKEGLVDIKEETPKQFWSVSAETSVRLFEQNVHQRLDILRAALDTIEPAERRSEQRGVWTVTGSEAITARVVDFFDSADEEIVYMTVEALLSEQLLTGLRRADDRGVTIKLGGVSPEVQRQIEPEVPGATMFESLWMWADSPAGQLMMVDARRTLVSALVNGVTDDTTDPRSETAIWGPVRRIAWLSSFERSLPGGLTRRPRAGPDETDTVRHATLCHPRCPQKPMTTFNASGGDRVPDETHRVTQAEFDWAAIAPSTAVIETFAAASERDPRALDPLYSSIDPDALDGFIRGCTADSSADGAVVTFPLEEFIVTVRSTGVVALYDGQYAPHE